LFPLAVTRDFIFYFATGVFKKVPIFTHFGLLKLPKTYGAEIHAQTLFSKTILKNLCSSD
jgi:hypothetical protein